MSEPEDRTSPFHAGEQAMQARFALQERMDQVGRIAIRPLMPTQHRELFEKLPLILLGGLDAQLRPWVSLRVGRPGFISSPDAAHLLIRGAAPIHDPLSPSLALGQDIGVLGLEFTSRRRNRVSARIDGLTPEGLSLSVKQSFGNCPKYIQTRQPVWTEPASDQGFSDLQALSPAQMRLIQASDSFFIASVYQDGHDAVNRGVDVSHRGGLPGFVRVDDAGTLTFPDFSGNLFFNTLGNLSLNPRAGLLFLDFERGDLLYLTGQAEIIWSGQDLEGFAGAERLLRFRLEQARFVPGALPLRWHFGDYSPALAGTGTWPSRP